MRIAIAADHAGYPLKAFLADRLSKEGHEVLDLGTSSTDPVDYPPFCAAAARAVVRGEADRAIVLGGSGQGEAIAANKVRGARAGLCNDLFTARLAREHNDANVLAMGARIVASHLGWEITKVFLATPFEAGRHIPRIKQLAAIEDEEAAR